MDISDCIGNQKRYQDENKYEGIQCYSNIPEYLEIMTTGSAGGMGKLYKGMLPASAGMRPEYD